MTPPNLTKTQTNALTSDALSFTAKGLLIHLMLMPNQEATVSRLSRICLGDIGVGTINFFNGTLDELQIQGIVTRLGNPPVLSPDDVIKLLPPYTGEEQEEP